jgi:hypothetical protein
MRGAFLVVALAAFTAHAQSEPPLVTADPVADASPAEAPPARLAPLVVPSAEVEAEDLEGRSTWRVHISAGAGFLTWENTPPPGPRDIGMVLEVGKPLYEGDRHRFYQWVTDSTIFFGFAPGKTSALLLMTPTIGTNFYLGPLFGIEWRVGLGFGATPSSVTNIGLGTVISGAISLRPFSDDRRRIKLQLHDIGMIGFLGGKVSATTTAAGSICFETAL